MSISTPFIQRPVATTLLLIAMTLGGAIAYRLLPVSALPEVDFPTIFVQAGLPGASPDVMAASVATPLEKQFTRIAGVTEMTSRSSVGSAQVILQFDLSRDINSAARDVQAAINASAGFLPSNLPPLPRYRKINPADQPILSDDARIGCGAAAAAVRHCLFGFRAEAVASRRRRAGLCGRQLASRGSRRSESAAAFKATTWAWIRSARSCRAPTQISPRARSRTTRSQLPIYASDQLFTANDYKDLVVVYRKGAPVRLSDLGRVDRQQ